VRDVIRSGALGELRVVRVRAVLAAPPSPPFNPPPIWRLRKDLNGGGILMNWGQYDCDYLFGLLDWRLQPHRVMARTFGNIGHYASYAHPSSDAETHIVAFVDCEDHATGRPVAFTYERGEFTTSATDEAWQIIGSDATLRLFMKEKPGKQLWIDKPTPKGTVSELLWEGDETFDQQHAMPIRDFAAAIRDARPPATSLEHSLVIQSMFDAMYASAATGEAVEVAG
jgi:predicted dehydrogenase